MTKDDKQIIQSIIEIAGHYRSERGMSIDDAVERAMDTPVKFGFYDHGNSWQETTGYRWGVNPDTIKQALLPKPGRPLQGDEPRRMRQMSLPDSEYQRLREIGNGNASAGVSKLLEVRK